MLAGAFAIYGTSGVQFVLLQTLPDGPGRIFSLDAGIKANNGSVSYVDIIY